MSYSPIQLGKVRAALERYKRLGSGVPGKEFSWVQMIGEIELYTDYSVLRDRTKGSDKEQAKLKNDAETLRQFVRGRIKRRTPHRAISTPLLSAIFTFLAHPEIDLLSTDDLAPDNVPLILAASLRDYLVSAPLEKGFDNQFCIEESHYAGVAFAQPNEIKTLTKIKEHHVPTLALTHGYFHIKNCEEMCIRAVEYITCSPIWERLFADSELPRFFVEKGMGSGRAISLIKSNFIETSYTGVLIIISDNAALCLIKDVKGSISRSFWVVKGFTDNRTASLAIIDCAVTGSTNAISKKTVSIEYARLLDAEDIRKEFIGDNLRKDLGNIVHRALSILDPVQEDYFLIDNYKDDVGKILRSFDPYEQMQRQSPDQQKQQKQQQQHQQEEQVYDVPIDDLNKEKMSDISEEPDNIGKYSLELIEALQKNDAPNILELYNKGARFDFPDARTGMTALHILANMGWSDGIRIALRDKSRCDFTHHDKRGKLASYHATVYGRDVAISRLLHILERQNGAHEGPKAWPAIRTPKPF